MLLAASEALTKAGSGARACQVVADREDWSAAIHIPKVPICDLEEVYAHRRTETRKSAFAIGS